MSFIPSDPGARPKYSRCPSRESDGRVSAAGVLISVPRDVKTHKTVSKHPGYLVVQGDSVWVGDWNKPDVVRLPAVGSGRPRQIALPVTTRPAGVTTLAAGAGYIWATVPDDHAVWRIDPKTGHATRIGLRYYPRGVAVTDDGIWVSLRAHDA
jgi:hypothetical protein